MKKEKINVLSLLGSSILNLFLLATVGVFVIAVWLSAWIIAIAFSLSPVLLLVVNWTGMQAFSWHQVLCAVVLFVLGITVIKPLVNVSKVLYHTVIRYIKFNLSHIFYEVEEK